MFGRISLDILLGKKYTWIQRIASGTLSLSIGITTSFIIYKMGYPTLSHILGPVATFFGQNIGIYATSDEGFKEIWQTAKMVVVGILTKRNEGNNK